MNKRDPVLLVTEYLSAEQIQVNTRALEEREAKREYWRQAQRRCQERKRAADPKPKRQPKTDAHRRAQWAEYARTYRARLKERANADV